MERARCRVAGTSTHRRSWGRRRWLLQSGFHRRSGSCSARCYALVDCRGTRVQRRDGRTADLERVPARVCDRARGHSDAPLWSPPLDVRNQSLGAAAESRRTDYWPLSLHRSAATLTHTAFIPSSLRARNPPGRGSGRRSPRIEMDAVGGWAAGRRSRLWRGRGALRKTKACFRCAVFLCFEPIILVVRYFKNCDPRHNSWRPKDGIPYISVDATHLVRRCIDIQILTKM